MSALRLFRFAMVGVLGFGVDIGSTYIFLNLFRLPPLWARLPAWFIAVTATYLLNVLFTFTESRREMFGKRLLFRRYMPYILSQTGGGAINISMYSFFLAIVHFPVFVSVAAGTLISMLINFLGASLVIGGGIGSLRVKKK